jgi:hypothetical protein
MSFGTSKERIMATKEHGPGTAQPDNPDEDDTGNRDGAVGQNGSGPFETDISETGEDGTTVRQAEVSDKDLAEVKPSTDEGDPKKAGKSSAAGER